MLDVRKKALVEIVVAQNTDAVYVALLAMVGNPEVAEDLTQETFMRAYRYLDSFDTSKPILPWLRGIARRQAAAYLKKRADDRMRLMDMGEMEALMAAFDAVPESVSWDGRLEALERCRDQLSGQDRQIVDLRYRDDLPSQEVGERLGLAAAAVRKRLSRIRQALAQCVERALDAEWGKA
jgi:RNA polymerase sigma-70 factor (ECF subfamily)